MKDILSILRLQGATLDIPQVIHLYELCSKAIDAIQFFYNRKLNFPKLYKIVENGEKSKKITEAIDRIIQPMGLSGFVKSSASKALQDIRESLQDKRNRAKKTFDQIIKKYQSTGYLADEFKESFMNNRRVLAVLSEKKRSVEGVFHGSSESGKICFIEPAAMLEVNRDIELLEDDEGREIFRILKELTQKLREDLPIILEYIHILHELDFFQAKARLGLLLNAKLPHINTKKQLKLMDAFHPLLWLQNTKNKIPTIPIQLELNNEKKILIISGPNAGGKTISLKTIGLHQLMLQSGMLVPSHENSSYPIFTQLLIDIGDDQSIEAELSTYSSRLNKMKYFLRAADEHTLFLIDEFGTGSDPELGGAMAEVILEDLVRANSFGAVTTHYSNIKVLAEREKVVLNACMKYDETALKPLYELMVGQPGSSYTFEVAQKIGLPASLIKRAKGKIDHQKVQLDHLLNQLQQQRVQTEKLQRNLENTEEQFKISQQAYDEKLKDLQEKAKNSHTERLEQQKFIELGEKYSKFLGRWLSDTEPRKEVMKSIMMQLNSELIKRRKEQAERTQHKNSNKGLIKKAPSYKLEQIKEKIKVGCRVKLKGQSEIGEVLELTEQEALVRFGSFLKLKAKIIDLIVML
jgi:DNA mismatch repair protein MutS2